MSLEPDGCAPDIGVVGWAGSWAKGVDNEGLLRDPRDAPILWLMASLAGYLAEWGPHAVQGLRVRARSSPELEVLLKHFASVQRQ